MTEEKLLQSLEGVIWEAELAPFRFIFVSAQAKQLVGLSAEEILEGKAKFINPVLKSALDAGVEMDASWLASSGALDVYEWVKPTGETIFLKDKIKLEIRENGKTHLYGITIDLSDLVQQERAERAEQQIIFDNVPAMIWYKDRHNIILRANKHAAESMGYTVETIVGKSTYDLYPEDAEKYYQDDLSVINSGEARIGIVDRYVNSAGEILWLQTDKIPLRDKSGEIQGVMVFSQDVTDRQIAEEKLLAAHADLENKVEERTRELGEANIFFRLSNELLCIAGFDGYFKQLNPEWTKILGYSIEELKSRPYLEFVHPEDRDPTIAQAQFLTQGKHIHFFRESLHSQRRQYQMADVERHFGHGKRPLLCRRSRCYSKTQNRSATGRCERTYQ